ncbi:MAG: hypothetical protein VW338_04780 [Rhodospirillaceae bacterium]
MAHKTESVFVANTNLVELVGLADAVTAAAIVDATVTVTVVDSLGAEVGTGWPLAMPHVAVGTYRVALPYTLGLVDGEQYTAIVEADSASGRGRWEYVFTATVRRAT